MVLLMLIFFPFFSNVDIQIYHSSAKPHGITLYGITRHDGTIYTKFTNAFKAKFPEVDNIIQLERTDVWSCEMARFGQCFLQNGTWNGEQVIPSEWISLATSSQVETGWNPPHSEYGFQWWTYSALELNGKSYNGVFAARGMFEQLIYVIPSQNAIVVFTSNYQYYTIPDPYDLMASYILPAITT